MDKTPKGPIHVQKRITRKRESKLKLSAGPCDSGVARALAVLRATRVESKGGRVLEVHDPATVAAMKSFFPAGKTYEFRLCSTVIPYSTDGSGNILAAISASPGVTSFPEWSGLSALFDEVNLRRFRVTVIGGASSLKDIGIVYGYNPNNVSATPASATAVTNLGTSCLVNSYTTQPILAVIDKKIPRERMWAETTVPAVASPPAGCVGTVDFSNAGASGTVSSQYFYAMIEIHVSLRNRI
jgi:hypothetical protein